MNLWQKERVRELLFMLIQPGMIIVFVQELESNTKRIEF
jgi:hypothetical protein